jgi:hypothetical protein
MFRHVEVAGENPGCPDGSFVTRSRNAENEALDDERDGTRDKVAEDRELD